MPWPARSHPFPPDSKWPLADPGLAAATSGGVTRQKCLPGTKLTMVRAAGCIQVRYLPEAAGGQASHVLTSAEQSSALETAAELSMRSHASIPLIWLLELGALRQQANLAI